MEEQYARASNAGQRRPRSVREGGNPRRIAVAVIAGVVLVALGVLAAITFSGYGPFAQMTISPDAHIIYLNESNQARTSDDGEADASGDGETASQEAQFTLTRESLANLPASQSLQGFTLSSMASPALSEADLKELNAAGGTCLEKGALGFIFIDLKSGRGVSYNLDQKFSMDTSFSAIYACYLCEKILDESRAKAEDMQTLIASALSGSRESLAELRATYDSYGWGDYAESIGISDLGGVSDASPAGSARDAAYAWTHILGYLQGQSSNAQWLAAELASHAGSIIGDALEDEEEAVSASGSQSSSADTGEGMPGICTCGTATIGTRSYLYLILTAIPASDESAEDLVQMTRALFALRENLA